jgi:hypothetical protein
MAPAGKGAFSAMNQISDISRATSPAPVVGDPVGLRYRDSGGRFVDTTFDRVPVEEVLAGMPVREFRSYRGRKHYSGWYWSATTGGHVVYESRLELARILLADQDPQVVAIAAQPFRMEGFDGVRVRCHVPDLLLGLGDGGVTVVDVKAAWRLSDPVVVEQFAWTREVCAAHGFGFEVWSGCDRVLLENIRFLAGYRRDGLISAELVPLVLSAAASPVTMRDLERGLSTPERRGLVRPAVLHLLWSGVLRTDLSRALDADTAVEAVAGAVVR